MNQSDPLQLVEQGSLARPGPAGRMVRLCLGIACLYALYDLLRFHSSIIHRPVSALPNIALMVLAAIVIINYVVNIGFGRSWGRWPSYVSLWVMLQLATMSWLAFGTANHPMFGMVLWAWLVYFFTHLGFSFVLSAAISTPGCEMRAIPDLIGRITGRRAAEHHCPAAFITKIDAWESGKR